MADVISFARGAPSLDIVDVEGLKAAAAAALTDDPGGATGYGTAVGYPPLRRWLADRHGVEESQVLLTNGSMQADALLFDELVRPGAPVVVERPTYDRTLLGLRERGAELHPITIDPHGIDTEALADRLSGGLAPVMAHVIPNFQNPAGYTLTAGRRERLLELARAHRFTIFEDDPYHDIRFAGEPLPRLLDLDAGRGDVVYASSFSKTVAPGVRLGYLVGPAALIERIRVRATNTYISPNMLAQAIVYRFCTDGGLERSIKTVRAALAERVAALASALGRHLPQARFTPPTGGYFMWVELPGEIDVAALQVQAEARGVTFVKGADFMLEGGASSLRLAYSGVAADRIEEGVRRLAAALASLSSQAGAEQASR